MKRRVALSFPDVAYYAQGPAACAPCAPERLNSVPQRDLCLAHPGPHRVPARAGRSAKLVCIVHPPGYNLGLRDADSGLLPVKRRYNLSLETTAFKPTHPPRSGAIQEKRQ